MSLQKHKPLKSTTLRQSARGEACTLRILCVCNGDTETTVLAHVRQLGGGGMGQKPDDLATGVYACSDCHDALDGRSQGWKGSLWTWQMVARALGETHSRMLEKGVLRVGAQSAGMSEEFMQRREV